MSFSKKLLLIFLLLKATFLFSQSKPVIIETGKRCDNFVPKGWEILGKAKGDLNKDGFDDFVLVIKDTEEDMNDDRNYPRLLLVLMGTKEKSLNLFTSNEKAILCKRCGGVMGDPFQTLTIKNGELEIGQYGGSTERWGISDVFKWDGKDMILFSETKSSANASDAENTYKEKIKTVADYGKIKLRDFVISND